jgi:hypothetical protein
MQQVEGQRKGSVLYLYNGFLYRKDREENGRRRYRCRRELCTARASHKIDEDVVNLFSSHNHAMEDMGVLQLKTELKKAAYDADARSSNKLVFENLAGKHEAGSRVSFADVEKSMYDAKRRKVPRYPSSMEDAAQLLDGEFICSKNVKFAIELLHIGLSN